MKYHIWTEGCQMNEADSRRVAGALEALGYRLEPAIEEADVVILNTCVVRQSAEDKAYGRLTSLKPVKARRPDMVINLMGCLVGRGGSDALRKRFPYVDVFSPPSDPRLLVDFLTQSPIALSQAAALSALCDSAPADLSARLGQLPYLPAAGQPTVTAFVPIVLGCSHACTYCVIPYRRGGEQSRPAEDILREIRLLAESGTREVTLLGQTVDRYGMDLGNADLPTLLHQIHEIDGLQRIRFLTSHPLWMSDTLLQTVADLEKVCAHIEVPVQAGDDEVLSRMRRGYTVEDYRRLIGRIRAILPGASIGTDIIVGFPGETAAQFENTRALLEALRLDVVHLARYSPRPGTYAARTFPDDVTAPEKMRRFRVLETLQEEIAVQKNGEFLGTQQEVLVEGKHKGRWSGRTRNTRLVFFDDPSADWTGRLASIHIDRTSAWSMQGTIAADTHA